MLHIETGKKNKILRTVSEKIKQNEIKKYIKLGKEMIKYVKNPDNGGIGLAAPQVGYNKRLIVVGLLKDRDSEEDFSTIMMINPEILKHSDETELDTEGCLSVPGVKGKVSRYHTIKLQYIDEKSKQKTIILEGLRARVVQHEIDHLDGILFTDKVNELIKD